MKKVLCLLTALFLFLSACDTGTDPTVPSYDPTIESESESVSESQSESESASDSSETSSSETSSSETVNPTSPENPGTSGQKYDSLSLGVDSKTYCVLEEDGSVFTGKNVYEAKFPASITKILTALLVCESVTDLNQKVLIKESTLQEGVGLMSSGVTPSLKPNEEMSVRDLLYALLLPSTNAAGNVHADYVAGSVSAFVDRMNAKVRSLGLSHSHFVNPHGYHEARHYTCAYDMAVILKAAVNNPVLCPILGAQEYTIPETNYSEERHFYVGHQMVGGTYYCRGVFAGKTGYTGYAHSTLVTAVERNGKRFYICTMDSDESLSYIDTDNLIRFSYNRYFGSSDPYLPFAHEMTVVGRSANGIDIQYSAENTAASGRIGFWNSVIGTSSATVIPTNKTKGLCQIHLSLSSPGAYCVQVCMSDSSGKEIGVMQKVLFTGTALASGFIVWQGQRYYVNTFGFLETGGVEIDGKCYYADDTSGVILSGFVGGRFYADEHGELQRGWIRVGGSQYYCQADGRFATGQYVLDGELYEFNKNGVLISKKTVIP